MDHVTSATIWTHHKTVYNKRNKSENRRYKKCRKWPHTLRSIYPSNIWTATVRLYSYRRDQFNSTLEGMLSLWGKIFAERVELWRWIPLCSNKNILIFECWWSTIFDFGIIRLTYTIRSQGRNYIALLGSLQKKNRLVRD